MTSTARSRFGLWLVSFCRETAARRAGDHSLKVVALMASLTLRDFASEPRPLTSRFLMSPNSYGLEAPEVSMPVARSRVSLRPELDLASEPSRSLSVLKPRKSSDLSVLNPFHGKDYLNNRSSTTKGTPGSTRISPKSGCPGFSR
jgi:hypothetical protein